MQTHKETSNHKEQPNKHENTQRHAGIYKITAKTHKNSESRARMCSDTTENLELLGGVKHRCTHTGEVFVWKRSDQSVFAAWGVSLSCLLLIGPNHLLRA